MGKTGRRNCSEHAQLGLNGIAVDWLYAPDPDPELQNTVRYILGVRGENPLFCIGINPSTAEPNKLDNTLKSVARLAHSNGFDGWMMLNLYPQRATDPNDLHQDLNPVIHQRNVEHVAAFLEAHKGTVIWAAWGTLIRKRPYLKDCLLDIYTATKPFGARWVTIGRPSTKGDPHHPLYLRRDEPYKDFAIDEYLRALARPEDDRGSFAPDEVALSAKDCR